MSTIVTEFLQFACGCQGNSSLARNIWIKRLGHSEPSQGVGKNQKMGASGVKYRTVILPTFHR